MSSTFHLVYLRSGAVLLSRKPYVDWREIQDEWDDYMTSLGPWTADEVLEFFRDDFGDEDRWPFTAEAVRGFAVSERTVMSTDAG